jgi:hypothetical protein
MVEQRSNMTPEQGRVQWHLIQRFHVWLNALVVQRRHQDDAIEGAQSYLRHLKSENQQPTAQPRRNKDISITFMSGTCVELQIAVMMRSRCSFLSSWKLASANGSALTMLLAETCWISTGLSAASPTTKHPKIWSIWANVKFEGSWKHNPDDTTRECGFQSGDEKKTHNFLQQVANCHQDGVQAASGNGGVSSESKQQSN